MRKRTALLVTLLGSPAFAGDIIVQPGGSIQAAIDAAQPGDRVLVQAGTYSQQIDFDGKAIELIGVQGAAQTVLDASGLGGPVVTMHAGEGTATRIAGFTITGGNSTDLLRGGGGISGWAPATAARARVEDCVIRGNRAVNRGGGLSGDFQMTRCVVRDNSAGPGDGGGIFGAPRMKHVLVANNVASDGAGGGLYSFGPAFVDGCVFVSNRSDHTGRGGAFSVEGGSHATLLNSVIYKNDVNAGQASALGGGVYVTPGGSIAIGASTIQGNTASIDPSNAQVGGVWGNATLGNTIVWGNTSVQLLGGSATYSNIEGGVFGLGNIAQDPLYVAEGEGDLHLRGASPCIDAGNPNTQDPDGTRSDIGAFFFATMYTRSNVEPRFWDDPSWPEISVSFGGRQVLRLLGTAGQRYLTLGTTSGTSPGFTLFGQAIPLNPDPWTSATSTRFNQAPWTNSLGTLDVSGRGEVIFALPPGQPGHLAGTQLHHAGLVGTRMPIQITSVSNPVLLVLRP